MAIRMNYNKKIKKKLKVLFIVPYPKDCAPSQRLKFEQYLNFIKEEGIEYDYATFITKSFWKILYKKGHTSRKIFYTLLGYFKRLKDLAKIFRYDLVYIHLEVTPLGPPLFEYIIHKLGKPIIYDIDDLIYVPRVSEAHRFIGFLKNPSKVPKIMKWADCVIVVTKYLHVYTERYNRNVLYIPPTIDTEKYRYLEKKSSNPVCIGWSGSHSTTKYLKILTNVMKNLQEKQGIRIKIVGDKSFSLPGVNLEAKDWKEEDEVKDIQDMDIGLYPLEKKEWDLGKGGLKALQYMGAGVPAVCTDFGASGEIIKNGKNGFLVDGEEDWFACLSKLIKNPKLRKKVGLAGRRTVLEKYSVLSNKEKMLDVFRKYQKVRIFQLISDLEFGGSEKMLVELVKRLDKQKYDITVCSLTSGKLSKELRKIKDIKFISLDLNSKYNPLVISKVCWLLKKQKVDILQTYLYYDNVLGSIAGSIAGVPLVISGQRAGNPEGPKYRTLLERASLRNTDIVVSNSHAGRKRLIEVERIPAEKIIVIHNGKELKDFKVALSKEEIKKKHSLNENDYIITVVGRLRSEKGHKYLFDALPAVIRRIPNIKLLVVGDGDLKEELLSQARKLKIENKVVFMGDREDVVELLSITDLFVMPSLWEGCPGAIMEAMAMKKPVLATGVAGTPEVVVDGETGVLVPSKNPSAISEKIIELLNDEEKRFELGRNGYERVKKEFIIEKMIEKYEEVYDHYSLRKGIAV